MAKLPTAEESARKVLDIYVEKFNCRPGDVLLKNNFLAVADQRRSRAVTSRNRTWWTASRHSRSLKKRATRKARSATFTLAVRARSSACATSC